MHEPATHHMCASCDSPLGEPFAHCSNCQADYCLTCGSQHFCMPSCRANGCIAGLCVRLVTNGELSRNWGIPAEFLAATSEEHE